MFKLTLLEFLLHIVSDRLNEDCSWDGRMAQQAKVAATQMWLKYVWMKRLSRLSWRTSIVSETGASNDNVLKYCQEQNQDIKHSKVHLSNF